jgi:diguanylate cyclase (GGDEF)-like protein
MSGAALAWSLALLAAASVASLLLWQAQGQAGDASQGGASGQHRGSVRNGCRWLAAAAAGLGAAAAAQQAFGGLIGGAQPLRVADLVGLAAVGALVIGLASLTAESAFRPGAARMTGSGTPGRRLVSRALPGIALDSCLLVAALFVICWVTVFGADYAAADGATSTFAVDLIRPLADLAALGLTLRFVVRDSRRALFPALAIAVLAVGDALGVRARLGGISPGLGWHLAVLVALCLLAATPASWRALPDRAARPAGSPSVASSWSSPATMPALATAGAAAIVVTGFALGGGSVASPALAVAAAIMVLLLAGRLAGLARRATLASSSAQVSERDFLALADRTIDAVLVCDLAGTIDYASPAVAEFGYSPADLAGTRLIDLVHPEDQQSGIRAAIAGLRAAARAAARVPDGAARNPDAGVITFAGRVRGSDGSWRHVEASLSGHVRPGEPVRLLVSARDVSDRVELRRQIEHLTYHDGLTGLPNRAYITERLSGLAGAAGDSHARVVGAIVVDIDQLAAVNELVGRPGGDLLLAQVGRRIRAIAPGDATVARWGGDEFAVLVSAASSAHEVLDLARRIAGVLAEPFTAAATEVTLTVSVGVAAAQAGQRDQAATVLGEAQVAMSKAQAAGGARIEVYPGGLADQVGDRAADPACAPMP